MNDSSAATVQDATRNLGHIVRLVIGWAPLERLRRLRLRGCGLAQLLLARAVQVFNELPRGRGRREALDEDPAGFVGEDYIGGDVLLRPGVTARARDLPAGASAGCDDRAGLIAEPSDRDAHHETRRRRRDDAADADHATPYRVQRH